MWEEELLAFRKKVTGPKLVLECACMANEGFKERTMRETD